MEAKEILSKRCKLEREKDRLIKRLVSKAKWIISLGLLYLIEGVFYLMKNFGKEKLVVDNLSFSFEWIFAFVLSIMFIVISFLFINDYRRFLYCYRKLKDLKVE